MGRSSAMQSFVNVILPSLLFFTLPLSAIPLCHPRCQPSTVLSARLLPVSYAIISGLVSRAYRPNDPFVPPLFLFFLFLSPSSPLPIPPRSTEKKITRGIAVVAARIRTRPGRCFFAGKRHGPRLVAARQKGSNESKMRSVSIARQKVIWRGVSRETNIYKYRGSKF